MYDVKFYLNNKGKHISTIYAVIHHLSIRYKIATRISVKPQMWNDKKMRCRLSGISRKDIEDGSMINEQLECFDTLMRDTLHSFHKQMIYPTPQQFRKAINNHIKEINSKSHGQASNLIAFAEQFKQTAARKPRTLLRYGTTINILKEFEQQKRQTLSFSDIDMSFYNEFKKYLESKDYSTNYIGDMFKNVKVFMSEALELGLHNNSSFRGKKFKVISEDADSIYLSVEELERINKLVINESTVIDLGADILNVKGNIDRRIESLTNARDRFLIGAFTGLRFQDYNLLSGLSEDDIYITNRNKKTTTRITIPMHPIIRDVLRRRNGNLPPPVSNQKMNTTLKLLGKLACIDEPVEVSRTNGGTLQKHIFKKYELITTHTARRSACTNMYLAGIPSRVIMSFSGHRTEKSFLKYIRVKQFEDAIRMKDHEFFN